MDYIMQIFTWSHLVVLAVGYVAGMYKFHELFAKKDEEGKD